MPPLRILVADDDAWILHMVTTVLEKRGYQVETACDGEEAYEKAIASPPDLLITDVMMPKMDGWKLVKSLRARPEFAFVPVIFLSALSSDDDRIRGFRLGADDYMPKPFRFEELDLRVAKTLRQRTAVEQTTRDHINGQHNRATTPSPSGRAGSEGSGLGGDLSQVGLSSLLTLLEMERKSGILVVSDDASRNVGRIFLRLGRIIAARIEAKGSPVNQECVFHMLSWKSGAFEFDQTDVDMNDEVGTSTTHLLMEGARRMDESAAS
ncbi:MAG TPA: response regulator [Kofleriaceae bacterium]|nr:response regulator [Kofleriaceae bacterium]